METAVAEVNRQQARHELHEIYLARNRELHLGNAIPKQVLDEALSVHAVTEAELQIALARAAGTEAQKLAVDADAEVAEADVMVARAELGRLKTLMEYASIKAPFDGIIPARNVDRGAFGALRKAKTTQRRAALDAWRQIDQVRAEVVSASQEGETHRALIDMAYRQVTAAT